LQSGLTSYVICTYHYRMKKSCLKLHKSKKPEFIFLYSLSIPMIILLLMLVTVGAYTSSKSFINSSTTENGQFVLGDDDGENEKEKTDEDDDGDKEDEDKSDSVLDIEDEEEGDDEDDEGEYQEDRELKNYKIKTKTKSEENDEKFEYEYEMELEDEQNSFSAKNEKFKLQIKMENGDKFKLTSSGVGVLSNLPIEIDEESGNVYAVTSNGRIQIGILPDQLMQIVSSDTDLQNVSEMQLEYKDSSGNKIEYKLKGEKDSRVLGFIKVKLPVTATYDPTTGELTGTQQTWLTKILDLLSF